MIKILFLTYGILEYLYWIVIALFGTPDFFKVSNEAFYIYKTITHIGAIIVLGIAAILWKLDKQVCK